MTAFGDEPIFAAVVPGALADADLKTLAAVEPHSGRVPVAWTLELQGEQIRECAAKGEWNRWDHEALIAPIVSVTNSTRTVEDLYRFQIRWWPFTETDAGLSLSPMAEEEHFGPRLVQAHRLYYPESEILPGDWD